MKRKKTSPAGSKRTCGVTFPTDQAANTHGTAVDKGPAMNMKRSISRSASTPESLIAFRAVEREVWLLDACAGERLRRAITRIGSLRLNHWPAAELVAWLCHDYGRGAGMELAEVVMRVRAGVDPSRIAQEVCLRWSRHEVWEEACRSSRSVQCVSFG